MRRIGKVLLVLAALLPVVSVAAQQGQDQGPRKSAFGFSYLTYAIEPDDGVFTDDEAHATQNFGFRFNRSFRGQRSVGWMIDGELFLGVIDRELLDVPLPETIFGLHAFVGPQLSVGGFTWYAAGGVNRASVPETELVSSSRQDAIRWVGTSGVSRLWAEILNSKVASGQPTVEASIPAYNKVAPAGLIGLSYDLGRRGTGKRGMGFRFSADFLPVFGGSVRKNFRTTLSITG